MINIDLSSNYRSFPALWIFLIFATGILIGHLLLDIIELKLLIFVIILLFFIALILYIKNHSFFIYTIFLLLIAVGIGRILISLTLFEEAYLLNREIGGMLTVKGWISEAHYRKDDRNSYILSCEEINSDSVYWQAKGRILVRQGKYPQRLKYGEKIKTVLNLSRTDLPHNPGDFNYRQYLQMKSIYFSASLPEDITILEGLKGNYLKRFLLIPIQQRILTIIDYFVDDPANSIMKALLLGEKQDIDRDIIHDFQKVGVIHVLAISGLHVGIILAIFLFLFSVVGLPYYWKTGLALLVLLLYMALVDFRAPVVRATLMAVFYYGAKLSQRKVNPINILAGAGLLILIADPRQLFSAGFQFSFAAVFSILYGYSRLSVLWPFSINRSRWRRYFNNWIRQPILVSLTAVLGITPLTWFYYGTLQLGAIISNLFIIPLFAMFLMLCFIFLALALPGLPGALGLAYILNKIMIFIIFIVNKLSQLSLIQFYMPHPSILMVFLLIVLILLLYNINRKLVFPYLIIVLMIFGFLIVNDIFRIDNNKLRITYVDVGQGDGAIIQTPGGDAIVIDGGNRQFKKDAGQRFMVPLLRYYGIYQIKYLIGSHSHSDHIGGLIAILQNISTDTLVLSGYQSKTKLYQLLINTAKEKNVPVIFKGKGGALNMGKNLRFYILHPDSQHLKAQSYSGNEVNNSSLVMKICYGNTSFLFTGDLERNAENNLIEYGTFLQSNVLKVGHHGSKTSTSDAFLSLIRPHYSVVSVGKRNIFYHPSRETIRRLWEYKAHPLRTDHFGALVFESDGKDVSFVNWRE